MGVGWATLDAEACKALAFHCPDGVIFTDPRTGEILAANPAACQLLGQPEHQLQAVGREGIIDPHARAQWQRALAERDRSGYLEAELSFRRGDGSTFLASLTSAVFINGDGEVRNWLIFRDVTAQRAEEAALRASEALFRRLIATSNDAFVTMNVEGCITEWNHQAEVLFGWSRRQAMGRRLVDTIIPPSYRQLHTEGLAHYLITGEGPVLGQRLELEARRRDGSEFPVELTIWALEAGGTVSFNALLHDISERRQAEEELWELALVDDLTGVHNRRAFVLLAEQAIKDAARAQRPVIAVFIDVDHLKATNDTHGHAAGDQALKAVAAALRAACRESDIIGRLSGDEFAILLTEATEVDGLEGRIRNQLAEAARTLPHPLSVSIGLAFCRPGQANLEELLERADRAMYDDKVSKDPGRRPSR